MTLSAIKPINGCVLVRQLNRNSDTAEFEVLADGTARADLRPGTRVLTNSLCGVTRPVSDDKLVFLIAAESILAVIDDAPAP